MYHTYGWVYIQGYEVYVIDSKNKVARISAKKSLDNFFFLRGPLRFQLKTINSNH